VEALLVVPRHTAGLHRYQCHALRRLTDSASAPRSFATAGLATIEDGDVVNFVVWLVELG